MFEMRENQLFDICTSQHGWIYATVTSKSQCQWPTAKNNNNFSLTLRVIKRDHQGALLLRSFREPGWENYHPGICVHIYHCRGKTRIYGEAHTDPESFCLWHISLPLIFHELRQIICPWLTASNREVSYTMYPEGWEPYMCELLSWLITTIAS